MKKTILIPIMFIATTSMATAECHPDIKAVVDEVYSNGAISPSPEAAMLLAEKISDNKWTDENGFPIYDELHVLSMLATGVMPDVSEVADGALTSDNIAMSLSVLEKDCGLSAQAAYAFFNERGI